MHFAFTDLVGPFQVFSCLTIRQQYGHAVLYASSVELTTLYMVGRLAA